jgi:Fur family ferric uptake transcriptional regulator
MSRVNYTTKQKESLLEYIRTLNKDFDAKDIYEGMNKEVGLTTIYRYLDSLVEENLLEKDTCNKKVKYRYLEECKCENHFYLKCRNCNRLFHIDCDCLNELYEEIRKEHDFMIDHRNIVLSGLCGKCSEEC